MMMICNNYVDDYVDYLLIIYLFVLWKGVCSQLLCIQT